MAITVALAILGTTLSCINTAVRVSYAMAKDEEMPEILGLLGRKYATPITATWVLVAVSALIGVIGVFSVVTQTGLGIASNLGTFILICPDLHLDDHCLLEPTRAQHLPAYDHPGRGAGHQSADDRDDLLSGLRRWWHDRADRLYRAGRGGRLGRRQPDLCGRQLGSEAPPAIYRYTCLVAHEQG